MSTWSLPDQTLEDDGAHFANKDGTIFTNKSIVRRQHKTVDSGVSPECLGTSVVSLH